MGKWYVTDRSLLYMCVHRSIMQTLQDLGTLTSQSLVGILHKDWESMELVEFLTYKSLKNSIFSESVHSLCKIQTWLGNNTTTLNIF
jgi:hypothetical protein